MHPSNPIDFLQRQNADDLVRRSRAIHGTPLSLSSVEYPTGPGLCPVVDIKTARARRNRLVMFPTLGGGGGAA